MFQPLYSSISYFVIGEMMKRFRLALFVLILVCLIPMSVCAAESQTIWNGVYIGNTDVSGMTKEQAKSKIEKVVEKAKKSEILVHCVDDKSAVLTMKDAGLEWKNVDVLNIAASLGTKGNFVDRFKERKDIEINGANFGINYKVDENAIRAFVNEQCLIYNNEAREATLEKSEDGFTVNPGETGVVIDEEEAVSYLKNYILTEWNGKDAEVDLPVEIDKPKANAEDFSQITDVLGSATTSFKTSGADRSANVTNGCRLVNGTTLYPGEEFSMYDHIKPFTLENGYRMAGSYFNGLVVDSLGGGICQVSTTLYNAVLKAELEVTERNNHSMIVTYVDASMDAAIAESAGKDFKFVNNTEYPIYIEGYTTDEKKIVFNIYGKETRPENRTVEYESEILETTPAEAESIIASSSYPVGYCSVQSAHTGYKARLIKVVKIDGKEVSRDVINKSTYKMVPRTAVVGIATTDPTAASQIQEAIATGSIDYCRNVAAAWAALATVQANEANVNP